MSPRPATRLCLAALAVLAGLRVGARGQELDLDSSDDGVCRYVLQRWIDAQGGSARLAAISSYDLRETVEINNGTPPTKVHLEEASSGQLRSESSTGTAGTLVEVYDGSIGWRSHGPWGLGQMSKSDTQKFIAQGVLATALARLRSYPVHALLDSSTVGKRACYVIGMTGREGIQEKWYFDKETRQLLKIERPAIGSELPLEAYFSDFRESGGFVFAFETRITQGRWTFTVRWSSLQIDPPVDETSFVLTMDEMREMNAVSAILARHAAVYGLTGENAVRFNSRVIRSTVESSASGLKSQLTYYLKTPNLMRCENDTPGLGRTVEGFNGQRGWMFSEVQGFHWLTREQIGALSNQVTDYLLPALGETFPFHRLIGERIVNGRHATAVMLATFTGPGGTFYFDHETGRLIRFVPPRAGNLMDTVIDFSDFRRVKGIEIPFVTTAEDAAGQTVAKISSVETDVPIDPSLFSPPAL